MRVPSTQLFRRKIWKVICVLAMVLVMGQSAHAEQKKIFNGPDGSEYEVHYIGFISTFLEPDVARQYQLVRSKAIGIVNVSVIQVFPDGKRKAVGAVIEANVKNDIQQVQHVAMRQVVEGTAIYYIGQVQFREAEVLTFDLSVYPQGVIDPLKIRFSQTFYND
jgi:hypothetical protein